MTKLTVLLCTILATVQAGTLPILDIYEYLKADFEISLPAQAALSLALAGNVEITLPIPTLPELQELHTAYFVEESGQLFNIFEEGYTGLPRLKKISSDFTQDVQFAEWTEDASNSTSLERRDICKRIATCAGKCADSLKAFRAVAKELGNKSWDRCGALATGMKDYLSENNYERAKSLTAEGIVSFFVNIVSTPIQYYINGQLGSNDAGSGADACGERIPKVYADEASSAIYQFCKAIQNGEQDKVETAYVSADAKSATSKEGAGFEGLARFFVAAQKHTFAPICNDFGIQFGKAKRALVSKLLQLR